MEERCNETQKKRSAASTDRTSEAKLARSIDLGAKLPGTCDGTRVVVEGTVDVDLELEDELVVVLEDPPPPSVGVLPVDPVV